MVGTTGSIHTAHGLRQLGRAPTAMLPLCHHRHKPLQQHHQSQLLSRTNSQREEQRRSLCSPPSATNIIAAISKARDDGFDHRSEIQSLLRQVPYTKLIIWTVVAASLYTMKDFFGVSLCTCHDVLLQQAGQPAFSFHQYSGFTAIACRVKLSANPCCDQQCWCTRPPPTHKADQLLHETFLC